MKSGKKKKRIKCWGTCFNWL